MKYSLIFYILLAVFGSDGENNGSVPIQKSSVQKIVPTFVYHRFGDDRYPSTNISNGAFESHLKHLKENGYKSLSFSESIDYLQSRQKAQKVVCLTVDDGYKSFIENGLPLLRAYGFTATVFVNTASVGNPDYLDWEQLKTLKEAGIEIGNHSDSHAYFLSDSLDTERQRFGADLIKSQALIEEHLGVAPTAFAFPYGEFDEQMKTIVKGMGLKGAAAQSSGVNSSEGDFYQVPRFPMSDRYGQIGSFIEKLGMLPISVDKVEAISTGYSGTKDNPRIIFKFKESNLRVEQLQCFVQGKRCSKSLRILRGGQVQLSVKSKQVLTNRRSLYTITVPDKEGKWHWYSYTWVIPTIEE
ncbi:MAG: polysaccharide deacetylase family protein [Roseivirga sp.]|nr:polysaccharide deacetylase family protein [Roseivirga sp.]